MWNKTVAFLVNQNSAAKHTDSVVLEFLRVAAIGLGIVNRLKGKKVK
jgi:hypothetical protein